MRLQLAAGVRIAAAPVGSNTDKPAELTINVTGVKLSASEQIWLMNGTCATNGSNTCRFENVSPGKRTFGVTLSDWAMLREVNLVAGETKLLDVPFIADLPAGSVGVKLVRTLDGIAIRAIAPGGPAANQLEVNDLIVSIDRNRVTLDLADAIARLQGSASTKVVIGIERRGVKRDVTLERASGTHPMGFVVPR